MWVGVHTGISGDLVCLDVGGGVHVCMHVCLCAHMRICMCVCDV